MIGYNPSHLNKNETLLEAFHRVEAYLKANPQYQVYQSSATYQDGTQEYALNTIVVPEGSMVGTGDVVLFSNVYYAVIISVSETTFSIDTATNFRGTDGTNGKDGVTPNIAVSATVDNSEGTPSVEVTKSGTNENPSFILGFHNIKGATGPQGPAGATGATGVTPNITMTADVVGTTGEPYVDVFKGNTLEQPRYSFVFHNLKGETGEPGPTGENGTDGSNGKDGNAMYLCIIPLTQNTAGISKNAITISPQRSIQVNDILISTATATFGAMAQVTGLGETSVTVNFIGTLKSESGGGGTTLNKYSYSGDNTASSISRLCRIIQNAKKVTIMNTGYDKTALFTIAEYSNDNVIYLSGVSTAAVDVQIRIIQLKLTKSTGEIEGSIVTITKSSDGSVGMSRSAYNYDVFRPLCVYYNDTEIT